MADGQPSPSPPAPPAPPAAREDAPLSVNLNVVSPSAGVGNLRFSNLPAATTILELKDKIRETLASHPPDEDQRLIHRGHMAPETATLEDVLGREAIRRGDQQTIHLVVRDAGGHSARQTPAQGTPILSQSPAPGNPAPRPDAHIQHHLQHQAHLLRNAGPGLPNPAIPRPGSAPIGIPHAAVHLPQHHLHQLQRLTQFYQQQEANYRHMLAQQMNYRGDPSANPANVAGARNNPATQSAQTATGPDGQVYSFRITMNSEVVPPPGTVTRPPAGVGQTSDPAIQRPLSAADVHNILHGADASRAAQAMANAMQRNSSGPPPANVAAALGNLNFNSPVQPIQPGVTTPIFPGVSTNASRTATPDPLTRSASHENGIAPGVLQSQPQPQPQPSQGHSEVYILSSPTGPRGLLISNATGMYMTPAARPISSMPSYYRSAFSYPQPAQAHVPPQAPVYSWVPYPAQGQAPDVRTNTPYLAQHLAGQQPLPPPPRYEQPPAIRRRPVPAPAAAPPAAAAAAPAPQVNHPGNPGAGALVAAIWPHIWLVVRLIAFAWWFSYSNPSWERWLSLTFAFFVVLAINTGILNGVVNNAFHPVREHLEGLIPFAAQREQHQPHQHEDGGDQNGGNDAQPDPAEAAARLVAQRRAANGNWLMDQARRIERAGVLFLASFAPGVAERHIRQLEEGERAERRAADEARAAAAAAQAAASEQEAANAAAENRDEIEGAAEQGQERAVEQQQEQRPVQPRPLLVET